ncbi:MAG: rhodanese-like domain-containing protein [Campylobacterota bacterium]|nr:rhodanese-like domain-containing protein [Campylobacterota bacterium]
MKNLLLSAIVLSTTLYAKPSDLEKQGVVVEYNDGENKILVNRVKPKECSDIKFGVKNILGGNYASDELHEKCKRTYITHFGAISPIKFADGVETYGELEVLEFMKKAKNGESMLLVDSRTENWYMHFTIPSAVNAPYTFLKKSQYPDEFDELLEMFGVKISGDKYDFSQSKTLLLFCNAVWCGQSPISMKELIKIGYPKEKLKWYRAGIQGWTSLGLPTVVPE